MTLKEKIIEDLKEAMKSKKKLELSVIRSIRKALQEKEIAIRQGGKGELSESEEEQVLITLAKQRRDSIEQFKSAGRQDLVENESDELSVLEKYLPKQLSDSEVKTELASIIQSTGAADLKDLGKVMGIAMGKLRGKVDGGTVQKVAKELLSRKQ